MTEELGADLSGLDNFSSLLAEENEPAKAGIIAISFLHEDTNNARQDFEQESLQELADSFTELTNQGIQRGILEPLLVQAHPDKKGHFIIAGGNRRYRAAKLAGMEDVPYILGNDFSDFDKFVLNDQRENLSPSEVALFITGQMNNGFSVKEIAQKIGRTKSYVSDHKAFCELEECIMSLYTSKICLTIQALVALNRCYQKQDRKEAVIVFCEKALKDNQVVTMKQIRNFVASLKEADPKKTILPSKDNTSEPKDTEKNKTSVADNTSEAKDTGEGKTSVVDNTSEPEDAGEGKTSVVDNTSEPKDAEDDKISASADNIVDPRNVVISVAIDGSENSTGVIQLNKKCSQEGFCWVDIGKESLLCATSTLRILDMCTK